jgi:signal transduction histidine kinase
MLLTLAAATAALAAVFTVLVPMGPATTWYVIPAWTVVVGAVVGLVSGRRALVPVTGWALVMAAVSGRWAPTGIPDGATLMVMLVLSVIVMTFVGRRHAVALAAVTLVTVAAPFWWHGSGGAQAAAAAGFLTLMIAGLMGVVRVQSSRVAGTFSAVFAHAPIAIMEQDWSYTLSELHRLKREGVTDIEEYLRAHRGEMPRLSSPRILAANTEALRILPMVEEEGALRPAVWDERSFDAKVDLLVDFFHGRFTRRVVFPWQDAVGTSRWHAVTSFPHPDGHGRMMVASTDITEVKAAEETLAALVESKDRFVAAISHELRTPLAAVVGFTSELLERPGAMSTQERGEFLALANAQALEAANIIADLLVAARADIGGVSVTHDAIDVELEIGRLLAVHRWDMGMSAVEDLPAVCADSGRIHQVLRNLVTNAARYGGPEQRIVCSVRSDRVAIEVRDDGEELSQTELNSLFEAYTRAHETAGITESVGLGLTVARHLAMAMGGSLVAFREGQETVFRLELPIWGHCPVRSRASITV